MQRTKSKLLSILLSLVMLLSLLPTTALAAGNYPEASNVFVDGGKSFYDGRLYYKKGDQDKKFTGNEGDYIAHYNPATGTLTLNGYSGGSISVGGVKCSDITVVLKGTNTINGSLENAVGGDITVKSSDGGTLSISETTSGSNPAIGIETGLSGSYTTGNVTIKGNAKVTINMTHNGTSTYEKAYGIFAKQNITISENASVNITCATPNNTTGGSNCNGMFANGNVSIDTNGTIKIDVTNAGKDNGYSFGVYPMGTAILTKVGNMEVQWKSHATHSSFPGGAVYKKGTSLSDKDYAINEDETNCYASYRKGTPYTVTVENGTLAGTGVVSHANNNGNFLVGDTVEIKPSVMKGKSGEVIPFQKWTSEEVTFTDPTTEKNSFNVPAKNVTVTAKHSPFVGTPTFTPIGITSTEGTLTFKTKVTLGDGNESFALVKEADVDDTTKYKSINPSTTSLSSPYEYSSTVNFNNFPAGNYYVAEKLNGAWYPSEKFTVDYTAASTPSATVNDVSITGTTGTEITAAEVKITLANDKFKAITADSDVSSWFTNRPAGLDAKIKTAVNDNDTTATIKISGNPSVASSDALVIKIPAASLASGSDLDVTSNPSAVFAITAPTYSVNITAGTGMALTSGTANQTDVTGAMAEVVYTANTDYYFPDTYSVASVNDVVVTRLDSTKIKVSGTPTANTTITLANATAKTKETTPTAIFAAESENGGKLSSVDNTMMYSVDGGGTWNAITGDNMSINNVTTAKGVQVKKPTTDSDTKLDSDVQTIAVTKAATPTGVTAVGCMTNSNNDGKLQNVTPAMEYQESGAAAWTDCGSTEVSNLTPGTYLVRVKANGTELASDNHTVTINAFGTTTAAEPNASFTATGRDAGRLEISGTYTATMKYSVDGGSVWNDVTSASMDITGVTVTNGIRVKDVGNGGTISESSEKIITVTEGTKPTGLGVTQPSTIGGKGKIETTTSHEYNTDGGTTFTACTGALDNLTAGDYYVRVKAAGTILASETESYTITAFTGTPEAEPSATFAATGPDSGTLSGLVSGGSYTVTGAATATFTASGTTHDLTGVSAGALSIVKKGNGTTTTDSAAKIITVTKAETPSTVTAVGCTTSSNNNGKLKNVTTAMEYRKSDASAWTPGTGSDITDLTNGTYYVRVKANGTELASDNQTVVIAAYVAPTEYTITFDGNGGTPSDSNMTTVGKKLSSLPTATHSGSYSFVGWYTEASGGTQITTAYTFSANTIVYAHWTYTGGGGGGGSYTPSYTVSVDKTENGTITVSPKSASKGDTVTITVKPDKGYELDTLKVLDKNGDKVKLTEKNGKYTFTMPTGKVTVKGSFVEEAPVQIFKDVPVDAYYYEAVKWAAEKGITGGVGNGLFAPNQPCTRAQIVTFLWRAAGSPAPKNTGTAFGDVKPGSFYEQAVAWAVENGITGGTGDGKFSPDATCTRAQSVTFLYRAAGSPKVSSSAEFGDVATNAYYADAVAWAAKNGITGGIGGGQFGSGNDCTRAQIVTFLYRNYQSK